MKIGYARVSTDEQNLDLQRQALQSAGCEIIYEDRGVSGASEARKETISNRGQVKTSRVQRMVVL